MDHFNDIPPPPMHGRGAQNLNIVPVDDFSDLPQRGRKQYDYDADNLADLLGDLAGPSKANNGKANNGKANNGKVNNGKAKDKDQNAKKFIKPVEVVHEGYIITKAPPQNQGEKPSWARVGMRPMPFDDVKLKANAQAHQKRTGLGPMEQFTHLSANQQGVVDRIIDSKNAKEKEPNAEWVLADVERVEEDIRVSFLRMERTTTKLRIIVRKQDAITKTAAEKQKQSRVAIYDVGEIIDLAEPIKTTKDKNEKNGNKNGNKKSGNLVDFDDDDDHIVNVNAMSTKRPMSQHRINQQDDDKDFHHDGFDDNRHFHTDRFDTQHRSRNDPFDNIPPPPRGPDPFAKVGRQQPDPFAHVNLPHHDAFAPQPHHHHQDPFAGVDLPPPGAIPIRDFHHQPPQFPNHNAPPPAPMAPTANPFMPEVPGHQEQWNLPPNAPWPQEPRPFGTARITTRPHSESRTRSRSRRRSESRRRHRREEESRERRERREESEERRRRRRDSQQESELRHLRKTVEKIGNKIDKVEHWDAGAGSYPPSSTASTDQDELWSLPRSLPYDSPATSPDRTHFKRELPRGSLHQPKDLGHAPRPKYYRDRRGPSGFSDERVEITPGYGRHERDLEYRGRPEAAFPTARPRLTHAHTVDDYPHQPKYVRGARYVEPRMQRRLTDRPQGYEDADFGGRGGRGVDFTKGRYDREVDERRVAGDRERRRFSMVGGDDYYR